MSEAVILKRVLMEASKLGQRLLRNSRGQFYTIDSVQALILAVKSGNISAARTAIRKLRQVRAGLEAEGASDTLGITTITITPEMVGRRIGVATVIEVKAEGWTKPKDERERSQQNFCDQVVKRGGIGAIIDDEKKLKIVFDNYFPPE